MADEDKEIDDYLKKLGKTMAKAVFKGTKAMYESDLDNDYGGYHNSSREENAIKQVEFAVNQLNQKLTEINNNIQSLASNIYSLKGEKKE